MSITEFSGPKNVDFSYREIRILKAALIDLLEDVALWESLGDVNTEYSRKWTYEIHELAAKLNIEL